MFWAHAGIGILIDIILVGVPVWIIYTKMMISPSKKRVLVIFSVGIFVVIVGAIRFSSVYLFNHPI